MELVDFLRARLDEDEALAREAPQGPWQIGNAVDPTQPCGVYTFPGVRLVADGLNWLVAEHIAHQNPARVLADVEAKRALLDRYEAHHWHGPAAPTSPDPRDHAEETGACRTCITARILARVYRDHPDFNPAWLED
ncbi:DUF6221 family protein [Streptomyces mirabilis]|uniref:DUF6221 family protein n=1 Tax=Streptomyces mirabilis TaxID=68239 RepID=UPI0036817D3E